MLSISGSIVFVPRPTGAQRCRQQEVPLQYSAPQGCTALRLQGMSLKTVKETVTDKKFLIGVFSYPRPTGAQRADQREHSVQTEGSLLGDRRKYPCGITAPKGVLRFATFYPLQDATRGMCLKT